MTSEVVLAVDGMSCAKNCATKVQNVLSRVRGVHSANVDFPSRTVTLQLTTPVAVKVLNDALVSAGPSGCNKSLSLRSTVSQLFELGVEGMRCVKNCGNKVQKALLAVPGVESANVSVEEKTALVVADPTVSVEMLVKEIREAGFEVSSQKMTIQKLGSPRGFDEKASETMITILSRRNTGDGIRSPSGVIRSPGGGIRSPVGRSSPSNASPIGRGVNNGSPIGHTINVSSNAIGKLPVASSFANVATFKVEGMTCGSCVSVLEKAIQSLRGVHNVAVALLTETATVTYDVHELTIDEILTHISAVGYTGTLLTNQRNDPSDSIAEIQFNIQGMTCTSCSNKIETTLKSLPGVQNATVVFALDQAIIKFDSLLTGARTLKSAIDGMGYKATLVVPDNRAPGDRGEETLRWRNEFIFCFLFSIPGFFLMMVAPFFPDFEDALNEIAFDRLSWLGIIMFGLTVPIQFGPGWQFVTKAWHDLGRYSLGMSFLVAAGTLASFFIAVLWLIKSMYATDPTMLSMEAGHFFMTAQMLLTFAILGKYLESSAKAKTSEALTKLSQMQADFACLLTLDDKGSVVREEEVPIELVQIGDILKVVRGAQIPADGEVIYGSGKVDESMVTGESMPVRKSVGDHVTGATINTDGLLHLRVLASHQNSTLSQIIQLVQHAQTSKAPVQLFADRVASVFVPVVTAISVATFIVWYALCLTGVVPAPWKGDTSSFVFSFTFSLATLVVACPCALGLATPTAIMVGTGVGAKLGVLIKGGEPLEVAHRVSAVIFDKTGTLTVGRPTITDVRVFGWPIEVVMEFAASAELGSEHPLGAAIVRYAQSRNISLTQPVDFVAESGQGLQCSVKGQKVFIGNRLWLEKNNLPATPQVEEVLSEIEYEGKTAVLVGVGNELVAVLGIADSPRPDAAITVQALKKLGLKVYMVTGDNRRTAHAVAKYLGISLNCVLAEVLPSLKAAKVRELQEQGEVVAMVGDGINDSPALAQADLGIAMGGGTDVAIEAAKVVLMKSSVFDVVVGIDLSRVTFRRIQWNFVWAMGYNILMIPISTGVFYPLFHIIFPPALASLAMALSSFSVMTSSLLLKRYVPPSPDSHAGTPLKTCTNANCQCETCICSACRCAQFAPTKASPESTESMSLLQSSQRSYGST